MPTYQVFIDLVSRNEDWADDDTIEMVSLCVEAPNAKDAEEEAGRIMRENNHDEIDFSQYEENYIWEVSENDRLEEE